MNPVQFKLLLLQKNILAPHLPVSLSVAYEPSLWTQSNHQHLPSTSSVAGLVPGSKTPALKK